jgi:hypothetical protein
VGVSGLGAIFAPEAAPAEVIGAEEGAGLIEVGGTASKLGETISGYARGGLSGGTMAFVKAQSLDVITGHMATLKTLFQGASSSSTTAVAGICSKIADGFQQEEEACANQ